MKKLNACSIGLSIFCALLLADASSAYGDNCRTEENANFILLRTSQDLVNIVNAPTKLYWLCNDIDLSGLDWNPIQIFAGWLEGNHHHIRNLKVRRSMKDWNDSSASNLGLFKSIEGARIRNLVLDDVDIQGVFNVGGLAGNIGSYMSELSNIKVTGKIKAISIAGLVAGSMSAAKSDHLSVGGRIDSIEYAGGLFGYVLGTDLVSISSVKNIYSAPEHITVVADRVVGGAVGFQEVGFSLQTTNSSGPDNKIYDCDLHTKVEFKKNDLGLDLEGSGEAFGGLVGESYYYLVPEAEDNFEDPSLIRNCHIQGNVIANSKVGGLVGNFVGNPYDSGHIDDSSFSGRVQGLATNGIDAEVGGIVGTGNYVTITFASMTGDVTSDPYSSPNSKAGGIIGNPLQQVFLRSNLMNGRVIGNPSSTGGLSYSAGLDGSYFDYNIVLGQSDGNIFTGDGETIHDSNLSYQDLGILSQFPSVFPKWVTDHWVQYDGNLPRLRSEKPVCIEDINDDGILDNGDISLFVQLMLTQSTVTPNSLGDYDGNSVVDSSDLDSFMNGFLNHKDCFSWGFGYHEP